MRIFRRAVAATASSTMLAAGVAVALAQAPAQAATVIYVHTQHQLVKALNDAKPGQTIRLGDGTYKASFFLKKSGTSRAPITITGSRRAVLLGTSVKSGIALLLKNNSWVTIKGITIQGGQKGLLLSNAHHITLDGITVHGTGMEGVHFRDSSTDNILKNSKVYDTGRFKPGYGEGVYIGSAGSRTTRDHSDRNRIQGNTIGPQVRAENIDVKEYTKGGTITGNTFDGSGLSGANYADSWLDVKGNGYLIQGNKGVHTRNDGFQVHTVAKGWGCGNVFKANTLNLTGATGSTRYGIDLADYTSACKTTVAKSNKVIGGHGLVNPGIPLTAD